MRHELLEARASVVALQRELDQKEVRVKVRVRGMVRVGVRVWRMVRVRNRGAVRVGSGSGLGVE